MTSAQWYAVRSHPHQEEALARELDARNFEVFYPRLRVNPVNPRARKIRPYFPGYLFVYADLAKTGATFFQWLPYSVGLVNFGEQPPTVPDNLIRALMKRIAEIEAAGGEILEALHPHQRVNIESGPFAGYEAIFDTRLPGSQRVRVLLQMINQRQVQVELDAGNIRPVLARRGGRT